MLIMKNGKVEKLKRKQFIKCFIYINYPINKMNCTMQYQVFNTFFVP